MTEMKFEFKDKKNLTIEMQNTSSNNIASYYKITRINTMGNEWQSNNEEGVMSINKNTFTLNKDLKYPIKFQVTLVLDVEKVKGIASKRNYYIEINENLKIKTLGSIPKKSGNVKADSWSNNLWKFELGDIDLMYLNYKYIDMIFFYLIKSPSVESVSDNIRMYRSDHIRMYNSDIIL